MASGPGLTLPQRNATVTLVASGGTSEDYDVAAGADAAEWTGEADAWLHDKVELMSNGTGGRDLVRRTYLVVPGQLGRRIDSGDNVTFTPDNEAERTAEVRDVEGPMELNGAPVSTARLWLAPE